jgi:hypothetical protein
MKGFLQILAFQFQMFLHFPCQFRQRMADETFFSCICSDDLLLQEPRHVNHDILQAVLSNFLIKIIYFKTKSSSLLHHRPSANYIAQILPRTHQRHPWKIH